MRIRARLLHHHVLRPTIDHLRPTGELGLSHVKIWSRDSLRDILHHWNTEIQRRKYLRLPLTYRSLENLDLILHSASDKYWNLARWIFVATSGAEDIRACLQTQKVCCSHKSSSDTGWPLVISLKVEFELARNLLTWLDDRTIVLLAAVSCDSLAVDSIGELHMQFCIEYHLSCLRSVVLDVGQNRDILPVDVLILLKSSIDFEPALAYATAAHDFLIDALVLDLIKVHRLKHRLFDPNSDPVGLGSRNRRDDRVVDDRIGFGAVLEVEAVWNILRDGKTERESVLPLGDTGGGFGFITDGSGAIRVLLYLTALPVPPSVRVVFGLEPDKID